MSSSLTRIASTALLGCGLAGCTSSLSRMDSRAAPDPVPPFDHMFVVSAAYDDGKNPGFPHMIGEAFRDAGARCGIKVEFNFQGLDRQPVGPRSAARSGMELSVLPNVVFDAASGSYKFDANYGYIATLTDRSRKLELWKASFWIKRWPSRPGDDSEHLAKAIPGNLFVRMAQDGVVHGCPPADQNESPG